ncbi:hypothetical protein PIB30_078884 [Stylosanthes scabra]|uniref:Uncharacterized protein n=1 Tax=Stylosanthes scabra TaxID=79078 RepID=A0ABU6YPX5_9FABA|nr:hypothetical protein [Stylosanthes scabra]
MADNNQHFKVRDTSAAKGVFEMNAPNCRRTIPLRHLTTSMKARNLHPIKDTQPQGWRDNKQNRWNSPQ